MAHESAHFGVLLQLSVSLVVFVYLRFSVRERVNAWVNNPRAQPLYSDLIQS